MATITLPSAVWSQSRGNSIGIVLNDVHSGLNATEVGEIFRPLTLDALSELIAKTTNDGRVISLSGGRHAMGGQQFAENAFHVDTSSLDRVIHFDRHAGTIEVEAGIQWPALIDYLISYQQGQPSQWGIVQKQTGADRLSLGGALSANIHGRGLDFQPLVEDIESFTLIDGRGERRLCSRRSNSELFQLAIGGYGLFGVIRSVTIRLGKRQKLQRVVEILDIEELVPRLESRVNEGYLYGDFQYDIDESLDRFMKRGILSCYQPVD